MTFTSAFQSPPWGISASLLESAGTGLSTTRGKQASNSARNIVVAKYGPLLAKRLLCCWGAFHYSHNLLL